MYWCHHRLKVILETSCCINLQNVSKCAGIIAKARRKLHRSPLITLYYTFAYPYFIYCNHVWGNNYSSTLEKTKIIQKRLVRTIACSPYRAQTEQLFYANSLLNVCDINSYTIGIFSCINVWMEISLISSMVSLWGTEIEIQCTQCWWIVCTLCPSRC